MDDNILVIEPKLPDNPTPPPGTTIPPVPKPAGDPTAPQPGPAIGPSQQPVVPLLEETTA